MIGHVESVTIKEARECRGRPRTNKFHIEKIEMSKEEVKFWRVYVLWWLTGGVKNNENNNNDNN